MFDEDLLLVSAGFSLRPREDSPSRREREEESPLRPDRLLRLEESRLAELPLRLEA